MFVLHRRPPVLRKLPRISTLCTLVPVAVGSKRGEDAELTQTRVPSFLRVPRYGKPDQQQAQGPSAAPASAEAVQLLPEQRKGLGFTGCVICDSALWLGDSNEPHPGLAIPFLPAEERPGRHRRKIVC